MISIAITGGIGSGKTYVSNLFQQRGVPIYNADNEAKRLMVSDEAIREELIALLGEEVYRNNTLNKPLLAAYLFAAPEHGERINSIVHPRVKADFQRWLEENNDKEVAGIESAILFEAGFRNTVDVVILVSASEEVRLARAMKRDQATEQQIRSRMAAQMPENQKRVLADYIIHNNGDESLEEQISTLLKTLKAKKNIE